jgi:hypothetical protein
MWHQLTLPCPHVPADNCLVLHATAVLGSPEDAEERGLFFSGASGAAYRIAGYRFSLDEIEHGILRCNAPQVGKSIPLFDGDDPRMVFVLPELDRMRILALHSFP